MLKGCLKSLALLALLYAGYFFLLRLRFPAPNALAAAAALGFVMWIVAGLLLGALNAIRQGRMLRRTLDGKSFEDGERVAVAGTIRPLGDPLRAPFSLRECVAYEYSMTPFHRPGGTSSPNANGQALTPSVIESAGRQTRLLAWPSLDKFAVTIWGSDEHRANARAYLTSTTFRNVSVSNVFGTMKAVLADDDGSIRVDTTPGEASAVNPEFVRLNEKIVPAGARVCAIGRWSAARNGIVPEPGAYQGVTLLPGEPEKVLKGFRSMALGSVVAALVLAGAAHAIAFPLLAKIERDEKPSRFGSFLYTVTQGDVGTIEKELAVAPDFATYADSSGVTALMSSPSAAVTSFLIERGASVNARANDGRTALHFAAQSGDGERAKVLLDRGAEIDVQDEDGDTPLMFAARTDKGPAALRLLILRKANLELWNHEGRTALEQVDNYTDDSAEQILLAAGAIPGSIDYDTAPLLPKDGGEPGKVVMAFISAVEGGDLAAANDARSGRIRARLTVASVGERAASYPSNIYCRGGWGTPTLAQVVVEGDVAGGKRKGWFDLRLEEGTWKICEEIWERPDKE
ncbi:MAG: ankyrin repeat domain-containing protein [Thermoanaerobaculia bacterium]|nr:ankyrin repeat domain-containing protein [Thermoanaerobaculia bacterium]